MIIHIKRFLKSSKCCSIPKNYRIFCNPLEDLKPFPLTCPVFDTPIDWLKEGQGPSNDSPSIDRMKPDLGYVPGNVRIVSQKANRLKQNATKEELEAIVEYMDK